MTHYVTKWQRGLALAALLAAGSYPARAQNVGIGTTTPSARLHADGDFRVTSGTGSVTATLGTAGTATLGASNPNLGQSFALPMAATLTSVRLTSNSTYSTTLTLYAGGGTGGAALAAAQAISFVANVPTTLALAAPLAVSAGTYTLTVADGNNLRYYNGSPYDGGSLYFGNSPSPGFDLEFAVGYTAAAGPLSSLYAATSGNVGIGTPTPTQRLEVAGTVFSSTGGFRFPDNSLQTIAAAAQTLSVSGQNLTISGAGGNTVVLPTNMGPAGASGAQGVAAWPAPTAQTVPTPPLPPAPA